MMTSHCRARSVLRTKPRRCGAQKYSTRRPRSRATRSAILFSNPCCRSFENGMLFGSEQTRRTPPVRLNADTTHTTAASATSLQTEDIHRASRACVLLDLFHRADDAEPRVRIVSGDFRKRDGAHQ